MTTGVRINKFVAEAVSRLFASHNQSDCDVVLCVRTQTAPDCEPCEPAPKRQRTDDIRTANGTPIESSGGSLPSKGLGNSFPAHQLILYNGSELFASQLDRWTGKPHASASSESSQPEQQSVPQLLEHNGAPAAHRPQIRVSLDSEAEVPATRAAIAFAYSGQVEADNVREILEVRRQAALLHIYGCPAECDTVLKAKLSPGTSQDAGALALEFYACVDLFPDGVDDPSFASVLAEGKAAIVRHFGDALATLQRPSLRQQLLGLPAAALEALLESDDFGTDTESSVLLLLATWMKENYGKTDEATRKRLCRPVRLVQLGRPYLGFILPALALDFETKPQQQAGWCSVGVLQAAFLGHYATATAAERQRIEKEFMSAEDFTFAMYCFEPRRQCIPNGGCTLEWHIRQEELEKGIAVLDAGERQQFGVKLEDGAAAVANGLEWRPVLEYGHGAAAVGVFLGVALPEAFRVPGSGLQRTLPLFAAPESDLCVFRWRDEVREVAATRRMRLTTLLPVGGQGRGNSKALPLREQPGAADGGVSPLAAWAEYLHDGKLSGALTFLRPTRAV